MSKLAGHGSRMGGAWEVANVALVDMGVTHQPHGLPRFAETPFLGPGSLS